MRHSDDFYGNVRDLQQLCNLMEAVRMARGPVDYAKLHALCRMASDELKRATLDLERRTRVAEASMGVNGQSVTLSAAMVLTVEQRVGSLHDAENVLEHLEAARLHFGGEP